jgi:hypothetical protein
MNAAFDSTVHIVVLMLENRSFDHMLGLLYAKQGNRSPSGQLFKGLSGEETNSDGEGNAVAVFGIASTDQNAYFMPGADPGEGMSQPTCNCTGVPPCRPANDLITAASCRPLRRRLHGSGTSTGRSCRAPSPETSWACLRRKCSRSCPGSRAAMRSATIGKLRLRPKRCRIALSRARRRARFLCRLTIRWRRSFGFLLENVETDRSPTLEWTCKVLFDEPLGWPIARSARTKPRSVQCAN